MKKKKKIAIKSHCRTKTISKSFLQIILMYLKKKTKKSSEMT